MPSLHLTDLSIRSLKAEQQTDYWDSKTPSFGIRIGRRRKTFVAKVKNRRVTIGNYPDVPLHEARRRALALKSKVHTPGLQITFEEAYEVFKEQHCSEKRAPTSYAYRRIIELHFLSKLRSKKMDEVTYHDISNVTDKLQHRPSEKSHAQAVARTFFKWGVRRHYLAHSPIEGIQIAKSTPRSRVLSDPELMSVWGAADRQGNAHGTIVKLLILTGQRRGEIAALQRSFINSKEQTITLPATLAKNGREHTFPYGDMVASTLDAIPRLNTTSYLFPARDHEDRPFSGWSKSKETLEFLPSIRPWTLHDLRRTFATNLAALGVAPHVVERLLNHCSGTISGVAAIYNRYRFMNEMREAIRLWDNRLAQILT
jgi:integrase